MLRATLLCLVVVVVQCFYLPGLAPVNYCKKGNDEEAKCQSNVPLYVNRLNSEESVIPYEYDHFDFCKAEENSETVVENLGQVMFGERIQPSPYKIEFLNSQKCVSVCTKNYDPSNKDQVHYLSDLKKAMNLNYYHHWIVETLQRSQHLLHFQPRGPEHHLP
ncbi:hypothetical protein OTU49_015880 [Cherax quadricarinatus]|uniref:Transmembrane 9 superfamily member n=1 Tax=Cherax quadricarinatus TaxID=27406 RepID=A0AAW0YB11_CHEQU